MATSKKKISEYHLDNGDVRGSLKIFDAQSYLKSHEKSAFIPHRHSFYQLIWFKKKGRHYIDYKTFDHPENSMFFVDKGQVHYFCDQALNEGYLFHFNDQFLKRYEFSNENWTHYRLFHELTSPYLQLSGDLLDRVEQIIELLMEELDKKEFNYEQQIYFLFRLLLLNIERFKRSQNEDMLNTSGQFNEVAKFHQLTEKHIGENHPVEFYSDQLGMSSKKLTNLVSEYLGNTPANIINEKKAIEAKRFLSNSNMSVKEVGYKLGFNQATYFTKFFKKHTGYTPKDFKRLVEEGAFTVR